MLEEDPLQSILIWILQNMKHDLLQANVNKTIQSR